MKKNIYVKNVSATFDQGEQTPTSGLAVSVPLACIAGSLNEAAHCT